METNRSDQDLALWDRMGGDVYERSEFHRGRLDRSGLGKAGLRHVKDLGKLPPMTLQDVRSPSSLLLEPRSAAKRRRLSRRYSPLQWVNADEVPLGYSAEDLSLLGRLGRQLLIQAGLGPADVIANLVAPGATREHWQFLLGAQKARISSIALGPGQSAATIEPVDPTVLIGETREVLRVLEDAGERGLRHVHTVVVVGEEPTPRHYARINERLGGKRGALIRAWAPAGVLALWGQCRAGTAFHTWPDHEIIEVVDPVSGLPTPDGMPGHLVWTGTGWYSSAIVRLATGVAVVASEGACPTCGRRSPRVESMEVAEGFPALLDGSSHVRSWFAELQRNNGIDELVLWVSPEENSGMLELVSELNLKLGPVQVQLVDEAEIQRRIEEANGEKYGDRRSF